MKVKIIVAWFKYFNIMMVLFRENAKTLTHCLENYIMQNAMIYIVKHRLLCSHMPCFAL